MLKPVTFIEAGRSISRTGDMRDLRHHRLPTAVTSFSGVDYFKNQRCAQSVQGNLKRPNNAKLDAHHDESKSTEYANRARRVKKRTHGAAFLPDDSVGMKDSSPPS